MAWKADIPRTHCFSLTDLHEFDRCVFKFFVHHHLGKKYELSEGNENQTIGSLLDLALKKIHLTRAYGQPFENLKPFVKAAEIEMRQHVLRNGESSFYGKQIKFLNPETINKATTIFENYYCGVGGKIKQSLATKTFWEVVLDGQQKFKLWGGPDGIELGMDGVPEIVDYKYYPNGEGKVEMDLMPKFYTFLVASELLRLGYPQARFVVRFWQNPQDESYSQEFDLEEVLNLDNFFKGKIEQILKTLELSFCEKNYCRVCQSTERDLWITELKLLL